jgi:HK97 family phage prohead protease
MDHRAEWKTVPRLGGFSRSFPLEDIQIRSTTDGRTVEAYAAVFNTQTEIRDQQGHYLEQIARSAFTKTLTERARRVLVLYNHGRDLDGGPSGLGAVPIGRPLEIRADGIGLMTVTRYNKSSLADSVFEAIRAGDVDGMSFRGLFVKSTPEVPRGGFQPGVSGNSRWSPALRSPWPNTGPPPFRPTRPPRCWGFGPRGPRTTRSGGEPGRSGRCERPTSLPDLRYPR